MIIKNKNFKMKKIFLLITLLISTVSFSQILDPVEWSTSVEQVSETEYDLVIKATIEPKWHLYSQVLDEGGPIPTTFTFVESENYELVGTVGLNQTSYNDLGLTGNTTYFYRVYAFNSVGSSLQYSNEIEVTIN